MTSLDTLPPLRDVIQAADLQARKSLGQNFLTDLNITDRIARAAGITADDMVVEIGPGPGGLTRSLLAAGAAQVFAVEKDPRFLPALAAIAAACPGRLTVHPGDAMQTDLAALVKNRFRIVANLPYNIATPLVIGWLSAAWPQPWDSMTLMFQKEVAQRLVAAPGSKSYGRLSVIAQSRALVTRQFDLPPQAFVPPPKVTSTVVHFTPLQHPPIVDTSALEQVTQAAFGQRRKMLRQSLKALGVNVGVLLDQAEISPTDRAENLSITDFERLTRVYQSLLV